MYFDNFVVLVHYISIEYYDYHLINMNPKWFLCKKFVLCTYAVACRFISVLVPVGTKVSKFVL